jgi:hypothetical protein
MAPKAKKQCTLDGIVRMVPFATPPVSVVSDDDTRLPDTSSVGDYRDFAVDVDLSDDSMDDDESIPPGQVSPPSPPSPSPPSPMLNDVDIRLLSALNGASSSDGPAPGASVDGILEAHDIDDNTRSAARVETPPRKVRKKSRKHTPLVSNSGDHDRSADTRAPAALGSDPGYTADADTAGGDWDLPIDEDGAGSDIDRPVHVDDERSDGDRHATEDDPAMPAVPDVPEPAAADVQTSVSTRRKKKRKHASLAPADAIATSVTSVDAPPTEIATQRKKTSISRCSLMVVSEDAPTRAKILRKKKRKRTIAAPAPEGVQPPDAASASVEPEKTTWEFDSIPTAVPSCTKCKTPLHKCKNVYLSGKGTASFKCNVCNTRGVQISRMDCYKDFQKHFRGVSREEADSFWQEIGKTSVPANWEKLMKQTISRRLTQSNGHKNAGSYLPLCWYKTNGFDTDLIQKECTDTMVRPMLGLCYNVPILTKFDGMQNDLIRDATLPNPEAARRHVDEGDDTVQRRGKPAAVAKPVAEKNMKAAAAKEAKEQLAVERKNKSEATKVITKSAGMLIEMNSMMTNKHLSRLPQWAVDAAKTSYNALKAADASAKLSVRTGSDLETDSLTVAGIVKECVAHKAFIGGLLNHADAVKSK